MPTTILNQKRISSIKQFSNFIEQQLPKTSEQTLWFRGAGKHSYKLSPGIHRHPTTTSPTDVINLESKILNRFGERSVPFMNKIFAKDDVWNILFFMQHYRIPTRLLDWSENPFIGLYFALTSAHYKIVNGNRVYTEDAAIWLLDPAIWNKCSLTHVTYNDGILSVINNLCDSYKPHTPFSSIPEKPIAIFGTHNSPRIVSQRGVFTMFGKKMQPMEEIYISENYDQDCLMKLILPKRNILSMLNSLTSLGITDSVVFPDLDGFAREIIRFFKFDI